MQSEMWIEKFTAVCLAAHELHLCHAGVNDCCNESVRLPMQVTGLYIEYYVNLYYLHGCGASALL